MLKGMVIGIAIPVAVFIVFLIVFRKKLRAMREKEGSIYQKLFKKNK